MINGILKKIGLNEKEIKIYLTSLGLGPTPVRGIAQSAGINRGTTYDILKSLQEIGLISYYHKDKHQYFIAEDPSKLKEVILQQQRQLEETKVEIEECLPQLRSIYDKGGDKPVAKYYENSSGIKNILKDLIEVCGNGSKEYYVYSSSAIKKHIYEAYKNFSGDRIAYKIKVKSISIGPGGSTVGLDERKWLTKKESTPTYTLIYDGKVAMISVNQNNRPIGVMIEDENIYQTQKMVFEFIWGKL
jgi:sugar-specific transcriptional regulator TrmB